MTLKERYHQETGKQPEADRSHNYPHMCGTGEYSDEYVQWLENKVTALDPITWHSVKEILPESGLTVQCYWNEYGEDIYTHCKLTQAGKFEGISPQITHPEVTHWRYPSPPGAHL